MFHFILFLILILYYLLLASQNIGISSIDNWNNGAVEKLSACSSELGVISIVVVHLSLGKHGKIFNLGFTKRRAVGRNHDHLGLSGAESLDSLLVSEDGLSRLHHKLEAGVHRLDGLLLLVSIKEKKHWHSEKNSALCVPTQRKACLTIVVGSVEIPSQEDWRPTDSIWAPTI